MKEVLVIGAGIIGSSIAWRLGQSGHSVTLVDAGPAGSEASWAGAGMLAPGGEFDRKDIWLELGLESMALYPAFVGELSDESGQAIDFRICGGLELTCSEEERARIVERARVQAGFGIESEPIPGGVRYPGEGYVDPRDVLKALRLACTARGGVLHEHQRIDQVESDQYSAVVVAAGAWSSQVRLSERGRELVLPPSLPVKGHLLGYYLQPGSLGTVLRRGHTYLLQRASGFTLAGSNEERIGFDRSVDPATCADIHRRAVELWPELDGKQAGEAWTGFRPGTVDGLPRIGRVGSGNVWLAYGHYRNGILLAPVTAQRIASEISASLGRD